MRREERAAETRRSNKHLYIGVVSPHFISPSNRRRKPAEEIPPNLLWRRRGRRTRRRRRRRREELGATARASN